MVSSRDELLSDALFAIFDLVARTNEVLAPALREYQITAVTAHLLWVINPDEPAPSMRVAAHRARCTPQNVTFMCRQLERRGLVERRVSSNDLRQRVIEITPRGRQARDLISALVLANSPLACESDATLERIARLSMRSTEDAPGS